MISRPGWNTPGLRFSTFAWGVFGYSLLVILWGYFLRISESGDGCGTDWPLCHGTVLPSAATFPTWVEFIHRISSGVVLLLVIGMFIWALRAYPRRHAVRMGAGLALLFTITESLFGAMLVVFGWVATDISTARILLRPFHVTNTFLLLGALVLTPFWASLGVRRFPSFRGQAARVLFLPVLGTLALAWTGSWTGLAATAFPAQSLADGMGQYLTGEHVLIYLRMSHPILALLVVALILRTVSRIRDQHGDNALIRRLILGSGVLAGVQLLLGPLTVLLMMPVWSRLLHLLLADLLWVALLLSWAALAHHGADADRQTSPTPVRRRRPAPAP